MSVTADLDGKRIRVTFPYDPSHVRAIKRVPGARYQPPGKGGPAWTIPADLPAARALRAAFGQALVLSPDLKAWGFRLTTQETTLSGLQVAANAHLEHLGDRLPALDRALHPYQRAGAAYIGAAGNPLVADQPGLGKTLEVIAGIFEAGKHEGPHLVVAPLTSLDTVWRYELERWQPYPVFVATGSKTQREKVLTEWAQIAAANKPCWLVINPDMVRYRSRDTECLTGTDRRVKYESPYPVLHEIAWQTITLDECHKNAVRHPKTLTAQGMFGLKLRTDGMRIALSGTPMGGKPINLWGILHYLNPDVFTSKWRWAEQWLTITDNGYGKEIGGIRPDVKDEFYKSLTPYVLRRTKEEVLPELPPKQHIDVWCDMTAKQAAQYKKMVKDAEIRINDATISVTNVLDEFTRLKQFATAAQEIVGDELHPIAEESGKIDALMERLDELGIIEGEGIEQAVIFSQWERTVDAICDRLADHKVLYLRITGSVNKKGERARLQEQFQNSGARVMVMTTTAGGVAITLDRASNVFIMDETWNPDDQEQAEDRCHRASRIHQVTVYTFRSRGTVEEYILQLLTDKQELNNAVMDHRRELLKGGQ